MAHQTNAAVQVAETPGACPLRASGPRGWLRRLGFAGFMFFLIKGLLWLTVPAALAVWRGCAAG